jgi:hypothetical protein
VSFDLHVRRHRTSDLPELLPLMSSRSSLQRHFGIVTKRLMASIFGLRSGRSGRRAALEMLDC